MPEPFSVVIPTYRRGPLLRRTLPSYLATGAREVIVVDDASGPPHDGILTELAADPRVRLVALARHSGQGTAKNEGARAASEEWVVFGEDDVWVTPEYPGTLIDHAERAGALVAAGTIALVHPVHLAAPPERLAELIRSKEPSPDRRPDHFLGGPWPVEPLPTGDVVSPILIACGAVHRSVFDRVAFDPRYTGNAFREETDFFLSCAEAGIRTIHCPHAACAHVKAHTRAAAGGSWTMSRPRYALQMAVNNWRFLRKHEDAIRRARAAAGRPAGLARIQAEFLLTMLSRIRPRSA